MPQEIYSGKSAYHGEVAARYDEDRVGEPIWAIEQDFVGNWVRTLLPGKELLDVPAGTGRFLEFFSTRGLQTRAVDVSPDMVAQIRLRHPNTLYGVSLEVGDAEHLNLPDSSVDYLISWRFFHLIPLPVIARVLKEFQRVCRDTVVVQVFAVRPVIWRRLLRRAYRIFKNEEKKGSAVSTKPWQHIQSYSHSEKELKALFIATGFSLKSVTTLGEERDSRNRVYFLERLSSKSKAS